MSTKATNFYINEQDTKGTPRLVLWALAECANQEGDCFPSVATIATRCKKSERAIQRALQTLESEGKIGRKFHDGKNTKYGCTNRYYLNDYRVSVELDPVITFMAKKTSPVGISVTKRVTIQATRDDANVTQTNTNTNQHNLTNTTTTEYEVIERLRKEITLLERELKIKNRELDIKSEEIHELKTTIQSFQTTSQVDDSICSSNKNEFVNEKSDLVFPMDFHNQESRKTAINILVKANIQNSEWQTLFDEFEGKITWKKKHGEILTNKVGYFHNLVQKAKQGQFNPESAKWVAEQRTKHKAKNLSLKEKAAQMEQKNRRPVVQDQKTLQFLELINSVQSKKELQEIQHKYFSQMNDAMVGAIAKKLTEVRT